MRRRLVVTIAAYFAFVAGHIAAIQAADTPESPGGRANSRQSVSQITADKPAAATAPAALPMAVEPDVPSGPQGSPAPPVAPPPSNGTTRNHEQLVTNSPARGPNSASLSLADLENLAIKNNPTLRAAEALVVQQQGLQRQLTRYPNPTVGWVQSTPSQRLQGATQGAFISQDIVTAGKLRLVGQAEKVEVEWRSWQLQAQIGRVLNDVRTRYTEVLGAQHALAAATELERLASEDLRAVKQLLEAKQASRPDVLQAEIHLNAVHASLQDARFRYQAAWKQLANLVGVPQLQPATVADGLEGDIPQFDWQETLQRLWAESPLLRAQAAQVREAELELRLQRRLVIPNINVQTVIQRDYVRNFNEVSTLVSAPIPLWNRNRGNIINAEGFLWQQQQEYERLQLALSDQLATSFQQYQSARNQVDHLREILPRTEENLKLTKEAFEGGHAGFDFLRVRDAEQTYYQTKISYIDALTSLRKVAIEISSLQLTGGLNPTEIGTALEATPGVPTGLGGVLLQYSQQQSAGVGRTLPGAIQSTVTGP
jgi:cobalt-zinc-cadmium efflux system outer membrane protein